MQTFLPYPDFVESARVIDPARLGNQAYRECLTLFRGGWPNHPASKMWQGHRYWLGLYALACLQELWCRDLKYPHWIEYFNDELDKMVDTGPPPWLGDERVHSSHRAVLLYKNVGWYWRFNWIELPAPPGPDGKFPYFWPTEETK